MRASPKSAILTSPRLLTRMFSGFRSRCSTMFVCRKSNPRRSCCITSCTDREQHCSSYCSASTPVSKSRCCKLLQHFILTGIVSRLLVCASRLSLYLSNAPCLLFTGAFRGFSSTHEVRRYYMKAYLSNVNIQVLIIHQWTFSKIIHTSFKLIIIAKKKYMDYISPHYIRLVKPEIPAFQVNKEHPNTPLALGPEARL